MACRSRDGFSPQQHAVLEKIKKRKRQGDREKLEVRGGGLAARLAEAWGEGGGELDQLRARTAD
jgi:hypothetical protein